MGFPSNEWNDVTVRDSLNASSIPPTHQPVAQKVEKCIPTIRQVFAFNDTSRRISVRKVHPRYPPKCFLLTGRCVLCSHDHQVIDEMQDVALKLSMCLSNAVEQPSGTPKAWSAHVCPFCSHTVVNAVIMPAGRTCCFKCAVASSSSCIFTCPITGKTQDIRGLRGERVLSKFLQRYFPQV